MSAIFSNIANNLRFRIVFPVIIFFIIMGMGFYVFLLRPIGNHFENEIIQNTIEAANNIYTICNQSEMEILRHSTSENDPYIKIKKGYTLGLIEDFIHQKGIMVIISEAGRGVLWPEFMPEKFTLAAFKAAGQQEVFNWRYNDKEFYTYTTYFDPWHWRITVLKNAEDYAVFQNKITYFYLATACLLVMGACLLLFYLNMAIQVPLWKIIAQVKKGRKPDYQGIDEFEYLSDQLHKALELNEQNTKELIQANIELQQEIKERRQIEASLLESEQRYRAIVEDQTEYVSRFLPDGTLTFVNQALCGLMQRSYEDLVGTSFTDYVNHETARNVQESLRKITQENPIDITENIISLPDGKVRYLQWVNRGFFDENNQLLEYQGVARDVTELKQIEEALRKSRESLEKAQAVAGVGSWEWDIIDNKVEWSSEIYNIFGVDRSGSYPAIETITDIMHPRDRNDYLQLLDTAVKNASSFNMDYRFFRPDGTERIVHNISELIRDEKGKTIRMTSTVQDITERKRMEEEKTKLEGRLHHSRKMEAVGTLAAGIAHDFNNILNIIFSIVETTKNLVAEDSRVYENLKDIGKVGNRAAFLVKQILTFSRGARHEKQPLSLGPLIQEIVNVQRKSTPEAIEIKLEIDMPCSPIFANPAQMHQVITNIIVNAVQAMEGHQTGELRIVLQEEKITTKAKTLDISEGKYVHLSFSDTGPGMAPETVEKIFDPYFSTKTTRDGAGLGLAIVYGVLKVHDAAIRVKSRLGYGTTFDIYIPVFEEMLCQEGSSKSDGQNEIDIKIAQDQPTRAGRRILFVDDEAMSLSNWEMALNLQKISVVGETDPHAALDIFKKDPAGFDIVITDQRMPHMTGYELSQKLRKIRPDIPILLATGWGDFENETKLDQQRIQLIHKPHQMEELLEAIERAIALSRRG